MMAMGKIQEKKIDFRLKGVTIINRERNGSMPEWLMGADCKSAGYAYAGSNPARPIPFFALVAQW